MLGAVDQVGIAVAVWPEIGLLTLAVFIGGWLVVGGVIRIVGALANRHVPYWWLVLAVGLIEVPLGIWAPSPGNDARDPDHDHRPLVDRHGDLADRDRLRAPASSRSGCARSGAPRAAGCDVSSAILDEQLQDGGR